MKFLLIISFMFITGCGHIVIGGFCDTTHTVRPGETLEEISTQYYGSELNARIILEANSLKMDGLRLRAGQKIIIPTGEMIKDNGE